MRLPASMIERKSALPRTISAYRAAFDTVGTLSTIWNMYARPPTRSNSFRLRNSSDSVIWSIGAPREYNRIIAAYTTRCTSE